METILVIFSIASVLQEKSLNLLKRDFKKMEVNITMTVKKDASITIENDDQKQTFPVNDDVLKLSFQLQDTEDLTARKAIKEEIFLHCKNAIDRLAWHTCKSAGVPYDMIPDIVQEAYLNFLNMLDHYDPSKNNNPVGYCKSSIQRCCYRYYHIFTSGLSSEQWDSVVKLNRLKKLKSDAQQSFDVQDACFLFQKRSTAISYMNLANQNGTSSLDAYESPDYIPESGRVEASHDQIIKATTHSFVAKKLHMILEPLELFVLTRSIGFDCDRLSMPELLDTLATKGLNLSKQEVKNIYRRSLNKIRNDSEILDTLIN